MGLLDMLPPRYEEDNNNNNNNNNNYLCSPPPLPSSSSPSSLPPHQHHDGIHSAGPSDAELFHTHQSFRNILFGSDHPNPNYNKVNNNKKSNIPLDDDFKNFYPDSFSNRVNLYGLHRPPQILEDHNNHNHSFEPGDRNNNNSSSSGGSNIEEEGTVKRRKLFKSYLKSEDLDVIDDDSFSLTTTPCLQLLEYIQFIANTKFSARVTPKDESSDISVPHDKDEGSKWEVLHELFDPTALIAIAVVIEEMVSRSPSCTF